MTERKKFVLGLKIANLGYKASMLDFQINEMGRKAVEVGMLSHSKDPKCFVSKKNVEEKSRKEKYNSWIDGMETVYKKTIKDIKEVRSQTEEILKEFQELFQVDSEETIEPIETTKIESSSKEKKKEAKRKRKDSNEEKVVVGKKKETKSETRRMSLKKLDVFIIIPHGNRVAACVPILSEHGLLEEHFIVSTVIGYDIVSECYRVQDVDTEEGCVGDIKTVHRDKVFDIEESYSEKTTSIYRKGEKVYCLYPETTCFYPAVIIKAPGKEDEKKYLVRFKGEKKITAVTVNKISLFSK